MKKRIYFIAVVFMFFGIAAKVLGADGDVTKWLQRPDMTNGVNIVSAPVIIPPAATPVTVADDWLCLDGSPVSGIVFWGSYPGWMTGEPNPAVPAPGVDQFRIRIYSDHPAIIPGGWSRPDKLLYEVWTNEFSETFVDSILLPSQEYERKYRYELKLPRVFRQEQDKVYWLNIAAVPLQPEFHWGWESSMDRWNDFAVQGFYEDESNWWWERVKYPGTDEPVDMSFELITHQAPIKWLQLPDMAEGRNIVSLAAEPIVADDWLCKDGNSITEIHFWGSYLNPVDQLHWEQGNSGPPVNSLPQTPGIEKFKLRFL